MNKKELLQMIDDELEPIGDYRICYNDETGRYEFWEE